MRKYIITSVKGLAMGAADVVPGVSGGTIAFLTGIYEELLESIKSIDHIALALLFKGKFAQFWKKINGNFLLSVFIGVAISIFSLARLMEYLLINHPIPLWSFFFGLIVSSSIYVLRSIDKWKLPYFLNFLLGTAIAVSISLITPSETTNDLWFIFVSGMVAICAMILPGISGSFILLLMGKYAYLMTAIKEFNMPVIIVFVLGAAIGIILFSHFLTWLLKSFHNATIALLSGFMVGSLVKIWPWRQTSQLHEGLDYPATPRVYEQISGNSPQLGYALLFLFIGLLLVFIIEYMAKNVRK